MRARNFRRSRRMFAVVDGTLLLAPEGDGRGHLEWLRDLLGFQRASAAIRLCTRGYVLGGSREDVLLALSVLHADEVGLGAVPGEEQPCPPFVTAEEYRKG